MSITTLILTFCVIYVNGLTDAPNSVATCIVTRCLPLRLAIFLSAIMNFLGVCVASKISPAVTETIVNMVNFGNDSQKSEIGLAAALFSIVLWAVISWYFGIPTSESHALIAGLTGSALALNGGFQGINPTEWIKAIYGLVISCGMGFVGGFIICRIVMAVFRNMQRQKAEGFFRNAQIFSCLLMSFMHGAQDGQKFIGVLLLCTKGKGLSPVFAVVLCSLIMAAGTATGGKKIIKSVGMDMVKTQRYQGFAADLSGAISLAVSTAFGLPVSTTHAKTTAIMGTGLAKNKKNLNTDIIKDIALAWLLTFPGCGALGYIMTRIFFSIF